MMRFLVSLIIILPIQLWASGFKGEIRFSSWEKKNHKNKIKVFAQIGADCLQEYRREHDQFFRNHCRQDGVCLSKFYGDRRYSTRRGAVNSNGVKLQYLPDALRAHGFPSYLVNRMENISCVGMALKCLRTSFYATGQGKLWERIKTYTKLNNVDGTALQNALQGLGWKIYYWNPAPRETILSDMKRWDQEELNWKSKGWHEYRYFSVKNKGKYYFNKVDNSTDLVGFGFRQPLNFQKMPFWVGTAHTGYHVFPGTYSEVIEAHSRRLITDYDNIEVSFFNPLASRGAPRWFPTAKYRSGLIAFPPIK